MTAWGIGTNFGFDAGLGGAPSVIAPGTTTVRLAEGGTPDVQIPTISSSGAALNLRDVSVYVVLENKRSGDVQTVANASLTKTKTTIQWTLTGGLKVGNYRMNVRRTLDDVAVINGFLIIEDGAVADA